MSNLFSTLRTVAESMTAYQQAVAITNENVTNARTPGYVKQSADFVALGFQPELNLPGGVRVDGMTSSRSIFSERAVWRQAEREGRLGELATSLGQIEPVFDVAEGSGIAGALDRLYTSFSQLSVAPNDIPSRETVIRNAGELAGTFHFASTSLGQASSQVRREIRGTVDTVNRLAGKIADLNQEYRQDYRKQQDAGLNARFYATIEELSHIVDVSVLPQPDGTMQIFLGGQTPLVIGDKSFAISTDLSNTQAEILDASGKQVTSQIQQGSLKGLLEVANDDLPAYQNELNQLAAGVADTVNGILSGGLDRNSLPPAIDLFTYDPAVGAAETLAVTAITPEEIAAADPAAPNGNANALRLAELATTPSINGHTFTQFYGQFAARGGQDIETARENGQSAAALLAQSRSLRDQASAVNLDEEAAALMEYQRAYQASARMFTVLNDMTNTLINILR